MVALVVLVQLACTKYSRALVRGLYDAPYPVGILAVAVCVVGAGAGGGWGWGGASSRRTVLRMRWDRRSGGGCIATIHGLCRRPVES